MKPTPYKLAKIAHVHSLADVKKIEFQVKMERPPNFAAIVEKFPDAAKPSVLFTYGHVIYNPTGIQLTTELAAHECTHMLQQDALGVEHWWEFYLKDEKFRYDQELDAYSIEYRQFNTRPVPRAEKKLYMRSCAERLSGPLYGKIIRRKNSQELIKLIAKEHAHDPAR